jgi:hypothetical protein
MIGDIFKGVFHSNNNLKLKKMKVVMNNICPDSRQPHLKGTSHHSLVNDIQQEQI